MNTGCSSWGGKDKYYDIELFAAQKQVKHESTLQENFLLQLLKEHDPDLRQKIERAFRQWNLILRDYLRNETALRLSIGDEAQTVPVRIMDGLPKPLAAILEDSHHKIWLLLHRPVIEQSARGLKQVEIEFDKLEAHFPEIFFYRNSSTGPATPTDVLRTRILMELLAEHAKTLDLLDKIKGIHQDILGAYFYKVPRIELYWMVIGLFAATLGVSPEALTVVVAAHELAHAYSHIGRDIDGERWDTKAFGEADLNIVEGLAQFYTGVICEKLKERFPEAKKSYEALLKLQSLPYTLHQGWTSNGEPAGEIVRVSMIQTRNTMTRNYADFLKNLNMHRGAIMKMNKSGR